MTPRWNAWVRSVAPRLRKGDAVRVPRALEHPALAGFHETWLALPKAARQWSHPFGRGRLHVHEHANGVCLVHFDRTDPERGAFAMLRHGLFENEAGLGALFFGGALGTLALARALR